MDTQKLKQDASLIAWQNEMSGLIAAKVIAEINPQIQQQTTVLDSILDLQEDQSAQIQAMLDGIKQRYGL